MKIALQKLEAIGSYTNCITMTCNLQVEDEKDCQLKKFYRKERRDFVISTIYCVSIVRFCCCVK